MYLKMIFDLCVKCWFPFFGLDWLINLLLIDKVYHWLIDWLIDQFIGWLIDQLTYWFIDERLIYLLTCLIIDSVIEYYDWLSIYW